MCLLLRQEERGDSRGVVLALTLTCSLHDVWGFLS